MKKIILLIVAIIFFIFMFTSEKVSEVLATHESGEGFAPHIIYLLVAIGLMVFANIIYEHDQLISNALAAAFAVFALLFVLMSAVVSVTFIATFVVTIVTFIVTFVVTINIFCNDSKKVNTISVIIFYLSAIIALFI